MLIVAVGNPRPPILGDSPAGWRWGVLHPYETLTLIKTNLCDFQTCTIVFKRANDKQTCPIPDPSSREYKTLPFSIDIQNKELKNHTFWRRTNLYSLYKGVPYGPSIN